METIQLICFTVIWTGIWILPLKPFSRAVEITTGLIPFSAFGLRVFAGFFVDVPHGDPIVTSVKPLTDWINGGSFPAFQLVLDTAVAIGLLWFAAAFHIPWKSRLATAWVFPVVAAFSITTRVTTGQTVQEFLATKLSAPVLALALAVVLGALMRWTPGPHVPTTRRTAAIGLISIIPVATFLLVLLTPLVTSMPPSQQAQARSILTLGAGSFTAVFGYLFNPFKANRSRLLFALVVGVSVGATGSLYL